MLGGWGLQASRLTPSRPSPLNIILLTPYIPSICSFIDLCSSIIDLCCAFFFLIVIPPAFIARSSIIIVISLMLSLISLFLLAVSSIVLLSYCLSLLLLWRLLLFPWFILLYPWSSLLFLWRYWCVLHCIVCVHVVCCAIEFLLQLLGFHCCSSDYYLYHCHTWFDCFLIDVDAYFFGFACDFFDMPAVLLMILRFIWIHCHFIDCYLHFIDAHCYVMLFYCCIYLKASPLPPAPLTTSRFVTVSYTHLTLPTILLV